MNPDTMPHQYPRPGIRSQRGVALVVALLFLLVVTIISVTAVSNSNRGLQMVGNQQDAVASFQAAESGVYATLGLAGSAAEPFERADVVSPFAGMSVDGEEAGDGEGDHPLRNLGGQVDNMDVQVFLIAPARTCPRTTGETGGSSVGVFDCDYYRVVSEHEDVGRARSRVELGVVKTVIGESG